MTPPARMRPSRSRSRLMALVALGLVLSACKIGRWQVSETPSPVRSIHAALLPTGRVLLVAGSGNDRTAFAAGTFKSTVWDPVRNTFTDIATPYDMFCSGHAFLPDGRYQAAGSWARRIGPVPRMASS